MLVLHQILSCTHGNQLSAMFTGTGTDIDYTIRRAHGILIMFDHDQAVAKIAKAHQRSQKLVIIPLMETDTWLVQNIGNSNKAGTDLCGKTDPLCLPAGKSSGSSSKGKILQTNFRKKSHSGTDLLQDLLTDQFLLLGKLQVTKKSL